MPKAPIYLVFSDTPYIARRLEDIDPDCHYIVNPDLKRAKGVIMQHWYPEMFEESVPVRFLRLNALYAFKMAGGSIALAGVFALSLALFKSILEAFL